MQVKFPFTYIAATKLGKIYRPYAIVSVFSKQRGKWQPVEMVIDSGADYTIFPKRYAEVFGVDLKDCWKEKTAGVGGSQIVYQYKNLLIKVGSFEKKIPVGFLDNDNIPPLLGRLSCLENFNLTLNKHISIFEG